MKWLSFPPIAAMEVNGRLIELHGPSLFGEDIFANHSSELNRLVQANSTELWPDLYRTNAEFRYRVDGMLSCWGLVASELPELVIQGLLFYRVDENGNQIQGYLSELNEDRIKDRKVRSASNTVATLADTIAAIATHCDSLMEAINLASEVPSDALLSILDSKIELEKTPEQKEADRKARLKAEIAPNFADNIKRAFGAAGMSIEGESIG